MKDTLGLDFITRTLKTTGVLLLIAFPFGLYYYGLYPTLAVLSGPAAPIGRALRW